MPLPNINQIEQTKSNNDSIQINPGSNEFLFNIHKMIEDGGYVMKDNKINNIPKNITATNDNINKNEDVGRKNLAKKRVSTFNARRRSILLEDGGEFINS